MRQAPRVLSSAERLDILEWDAVRAWARALPETLGVDGR